MGTRQLLLGMCPLTYHQNRIFIWPRTLCFVLILVMTYYLYGVLPFSDNDTVSQ